MRQSSGAALALYFALAQIGPVQLLFAQGSPAVAAQAAPAQGSPAPTQAAPARTSPAQASRGKSALVKAAPAQAGFCKTLKGEWVGFGEEDTRKEAEARLDTEIASWRQRYNMLPAKAKDRKVNCKIYLKFLDEYFCTADAVVCR